MVQIQPGGVQQDGVRRLFQGGDGAVLVLIVPRPDVAEDGLIVRRLSPLLQLQQAAAGPGLRGGGKEDLYIGIGLAETWEAAPDTLCRRMAPLTSSPSRYIFCTPSS